MKARTPLVATVMAGIVATLTACSDDEGQGGVTYSLDDVEDFVPTSETYAYEQSRISSAGSVWTWGWPGGSEFEFEPAECLTFLTSVEMMLPSDESETADDQVVYFNGAVRADENSSNDYNEVYGTIRLFSSASAASDFVEDLEASASPCSQGYSYSSSMLEWTVEAIQVTDDGLPGVEDVLVINERHAVGQNGPDSYMYFDFYTHYVYAQGNLVIVALYGGSTGSAPDEEAAELISQLIEHLG